MTRRFQRVYRARKTKRVNSMVIDYSVCLNGENFRIKLFEKKPDLN